MAGGGKQLIDRRVSELAKRDHDSCQLREQLENEQPSMQVKTLPVTCNEIELCSTVGGYCENSKGSRITCAIQLEPNAF